MINILVVLLGIISAPKIVHSIKLNNHLFGSPMDILMMCFYLANILSLLVAERIQDSTPVRMVTSAVIAYFVVKVHVPSQKVKVAIIHALGIAVIGIATLSVLQAFLPEAMNAIAIKFFQGREAYGLAIEQGRGRIAPWGSIILIFPFYFSSLFFGRHRKNKAYLTYLFGGIIILLLAMTLSNFRWTFLVFIICTLVQAKFFMTLKFFTSQQVFRAFVLSTIVLALGLAGAKFTLGYNLVDRFLLTNNARDVSDTLGRLLLYSQAINIFSSSPITGVGIGNYYSLVGAFQINRYFSVFDQFEVFLVPIASHNEFLTVLAETGILGFACYFFIMYFSFKTILKLLAQAKRLSVIDTVCVVTCFVSLLSFVLYTMFENIYPENIVYIFILISIIHTWFSPSPTKQTVNSYEA
jgi:O-antigen ligase